MSDRNILKIVLDNSTDEVVTVIGSELNPGEATWVDGGVPQDGETIANDGNGTFKASAPNDIGFQAVVQFTAGSLGSFQLEFGFAVTGQSFVAPQAVGSLQFNVTPVETPLETAAEYKVTVKRG